MGYLRDLEVAAINMDNLKDALEDLKSIALKTDVTEEDFKSVAEDYELNPVLLKNKFAASYGDSANVRKLAEVTNPKTAMSNKSDKKIDELCKYYRVPRSRIIEAVYKGKQVTIICKTRGNSVIGVDHEDGNSYKWNPAAARSMQFKSPIQNSTEE